VRSAVIDKNKTNETGWLHTLVHPTGNSNAVTVDDVPQWLGIHPTDSFANLNDHAMPGHQNLDAKLDFVLKFTWL
jgi:hypothetical protein